jgi:RNA polymerase sporulation-specific sigma factor
MAEEVSFNLDELISQYIPYIEKKAAAIKTDGFGKDDIRQEAYIALFDAMKSYSADRGCSFKSFALTCINNRIISFVRQFKSLKNLPLSNFASLETEDAVSDYDPEKILSEKEDLMALQNKLADSLSANERKVLSLYLNGDSIKEISASLGVSEKSVQNSLYRIRQKIKAIVRSGGLAYMPM